MLQLVLLRPRIGHPQLQGLVKTLWALARLWSQLLLRLLLQIHLLQQPLQLLLT